MGRRPLAVASAAFVAGAFLGCIPSANEVDVALIGALAAACVSLWRRPRLVAFALALGLVRGAVREKPAALEASREELEATVVSVQPRRDFTEAILRVSAPREPLALVSLRGLPVHRGDRVLAVANLYAPSPQLNPGGRDRRADLAVRGIGAIGSAEVVEVRARGPALWRAIDALRARFTARAALLCTTRERAALVAALGVGDRSALTAQEEDELAASGLVHLLASAGLHLAVVALLVRSLSAWLWLRSPWAARARSAAVGSLVALPFVAAEVLVLGAPWPAMRAGAGAALALLALALGRRSDGLTALASAAAGCALLDPAATHDLALQLSILGVLGIVLFTAPLRDLVPLPRPLHPRLLRRLGEHLLELGCATCAATLCTAPLLAAAFHRLSLVSPLANTLGLVPGLVAIPASTLLLAFDAVPLWWAADLLAGATLGAARAFAQVPLAAVAVAAPGAVVCLLWYCGVLLLGGAPAPLGPGTAQLRPRPRTRLLRAAVPWSALALLGCAHAAAPLWSRSMRLTFLAIGQGDAALVQLPSGHAVLVDAGGDLRSFPSDRAGREVLSTLAELGVSRLDLLVLTHPHPDHAGGVPAVLDHLRVEELWMPAAHDPISDAVIRKARERGVPVHEPRSRELAGVRLEVLSRAWDEGRSANDNSIVLRLVHGEVRVLLAGDVEALAELELAQAPVAAQLLKAGHHGSRTSSTDAFLRAVQPAHVVYSVGAHNSFGFPHEDVVERTRALGARTFRTDEGAVLAESDGRTLAVRQWPATP